MRYQVVESYREDYPLKVLCETLEVSVSGYYQWRKRAMSPHGREDVLLAEQVKKAFHANRQVYGSPRIHTELRAQGIRCGQKRVARLMQEQGPAARRSSYRTITTQSDPEVYVAPNLLRRDFTADQPNRKWVADTTYIDSQSFQTRTQARSAPFDYIEPFYNRTRRHSTLQYLSPLVYEQVMGSV